VQFCAFGYLPNSAQNYEDKDTRQIIPASVSIRGSPLLAWRGCPSSRNLQARMASTFTQTGGARISIFNATWPFATFEVADSELRLRCFWKCWTFPKSQITRLSEHRSVFTGLRIQHSITSYAQFIVFWTSSFGELKRALEERGYMVYDQAD
jgi:hypothetical protein